MSELKFRAWNGKEKQFAHWDVNNSKWDVFARLWAEIDGELDDSQIAEVEQYTGLKDKNGKEIYEGDVLQNPEDDTATVFWRKQEAEWGVRWNTNKAEYSLADSMHWDALNIVIGNIHENPELMEGAK